jgi:hypothetical protein
MMGADCTKCNLLSLPIYFIKESLVREHAVISVTMLNKTLCLSHGFLEGVHGKNSFSHREIMHEMNVNEITNVIAKMSTSPDSSAG